MVEEQDVETTFSPTNSSKDHLNAKQLPQNNLNAGRRHQAPKKAANSLRTEVGQNIKDKKRDKRDRDGDASWEGSHEGEVSKQQETLSLADLWGILESQRAT